MTLRLKIAIAALVFMAGCQELPNFLVGDHTLARVGRIELSQRELGQSIPSGLVGDDSVAFVDLYVDRWIKKQLKLQEAEKIFSTTEEDIDRLVEEYRQTLLIRKLDQFYVDLLVDTTFTDNEIAAYYKEHSAEFRLDRTLVRGRVVRLPEEYRQSKKLLDLMGSPAAERQQDFRDICLKNNFQLHEFSDSWVDFTEFLSFLPTLRSQSYDEALDSHQVRQMRGDNAIYYYQITSVLRAGDPIPFDQIRANIKRIIFNQRQSELLREHEQELYEKAASDGDFRIYKNNKTER